MPAKATTRSAAPSLVGFDGRAADMTSDDAGGNDSTGTSTFLGRELELAQRQGAATGMFASNVPNANLVAELNYAAGDATTIRQPGIIIASEELPSWKQVLDIYNRRIQVDTREAVFEATLQSRQMNAAMRHIAGVRDLLHGTSWRETKAMMRKRMYDTVKKAVDVIVPDPEEPEAVNRVQYDEMFGAGGGDQTAGAGGTKFFTHGLEIFDPYNIPTVRLQHKQEGQDVLENWNAEYDLYYSQMDRVAKSRFLKSTLRKRFKQGAITDSKVAERQAAINEMSDLPRLRLQFRVESSAAGKKEDILYLGIMEAKDLPGKGVGRTRANPYCKVNFKPKKMPMEIQTRMKLNTVNPVWKEIVQIAGFPLALIKRQTLVVRVFDKDELVYDELLGEVHVAMAKYTISQGKIDEWFTLRNLPESHMPKPKGRVRLGLVYDNVANDLAINILKLKELGGKKKMKKKRKSLLYILFRYRPKRKRRKNKQGQLDIEQARLGDMSGYVIITKLRRIVNHEIQVVSSQRHVLHSLAHQQYYNKANFPIQLLYEDMRPTDLTHSLFTVQVLERRFKFFYRAIGEVTLSPDSRDKRAAQHWRDIETNPGELFTRWHTLVSVNKWENQDDY